MRFAHFFKEGELAEIDYDELRVLIDQCNFIRKKQLSEILNQDDFKSLICVYDDMDMVCGFASVGLEYGYLQLHALFVSKEARGCGYGKGLLKEVKAFASHLGLDFVQLIALEENEVALKLYEKNGFLYLSKHSYFSDDMKMYVKDLPYVVGGMLNAIAKRYGRNNLLQGLKQCKESGDMAIFDNAFKMPIKKRGMENVLQGKLIAVCAKMLDGLGDVKTGEEGVNRLLFRTLERNYQKEYVDRILPGVSRETAHDLALCLDAYYSFQKQENLKMVFSSNETAIRKG